MSMSFCILCYNLFMVHAKLKELRAEKGLTQAALAQKLECSQSMIVRWERGECEPTANAIIKIATFFDVTTDYLLGREDDFGSVTISSGNVSGNNNTVNSHNTIHARTVAQLSESDAELLHKYHAAPDKIKKAIKELLS